MFNWVGEFKLLFSILLIACTTQQAYASASGKSSQDLNEVEWTKFSREVRDLKKEDYRNGLSYILSGSIALAGGIWGENITDDDVEKGVYTVFQSIGIASVGYGAFLWKVGGEERALYDTLELTRNLSRREKTEFLRAYFLQKREKKRKERLIKAITHGLVAGLNIYNASRQNQDGVKNALYFIGGVNLLAAASFTFEF